MSSFSSGLKLSIKIGSSNEALCFLLNVFFLKDASTSSGFMPALRHLQQMRHLDSWSLAWRVSPVKSAPLAAPPVGQVNAAVPGPLHAAVGLPYAPPEEGSTRVARHGPVVKVGGARAVADAALSGQSPLKWTINLLLTMKSKILDLSGTDSSGKRLKLIAW